MSGVVEVAENSLQVSPLVLNLLLQNCCKLLLLDLGHDFYQTSPLFGSLGNILRIFLEGKDASILDSKERFSRSGHLLSILVLSENWQPFVLFCFRVAHVEEEIGLVLLKYGASVNTIWRNYLNSLALFFKRGELYLNGAGREPGTAEEQEGVSKNGVLIQA